MIGFKRVSLSKYEYRFFGDFGLGTVTFDEKGHMIKLDISDEYSSNLKFRLEICGVNLAKENFPDSRTFAYF